MVSAEWKALSQALQAGGLRPGIYVSRDEAWSNLAILPTLYKWKQTDILCRCLSTSIFEYPMISNMYLYIVYIHKHVRYVCICISMYKYVCIHGLHLHIHIYIYCMYIYLYIYIYVYVK